MAWINHSGQTLAHSSYCSRSLHLPSAYTLLYFSLLSVRINLPAFAKKNRGSTSECRDKFSIFFTPPLWEPPELQSLHQHGTTALLYRASRRVLNPATFLPLEPACARFVHRRLSLQSTNISTNRSNDKKYSKEGIKAVCHKCGCSMSLMRRCNFGV